MVSVSKYVRNQVVGLLKDETVGFNPTLATIAETFQVPAFTLDFGPKSTNVMQGWYAAKDLVATSTFKFPLMCLYSVKSQNTNENKFLTFSGSIMMGLDIYIGFKPSRAKNDTDDTMDAIEATLYTLFNSSDNASFFGKVIYNGDLTVKRSPIIQGADNWLQLMPCTLTFDLDVT